VADTFQLEVATPERLLVDEQVREAELPGANGYLGVLPGHAPLLSALGAGVLTYTSGSEHRYLAINGGFVEVLGDHVRVLAEQAEYGRDINLDAARRELEQANNRLREHSNDKDQSEAAIRDSAKAQARIDAATKAQGSY
jgi:F-type H+-transporting ATPase subunit epsilon